MNRTEQTQRVVLKITIAFNAALVVFGCLLLLLDARNAASPGTTHDRATQELVYDLANKLRLAIEVTERVGNGAQTARRVQRILAKLVRTCTMLIGKFRRGPIFSTAKLIERTQVSTTGEHKTPADRVGV